MLGGPELSFSFFFFGGGGVARASGEFGTCLVVVGFVGELGREYWFFFFSFKFV